MRAITSQTAAQVLGITPKQLDNLLARIGPESFGAPGRQGKARRIPIRALPELALTLEIVSGFGTTVRAAHRIAASICETRHPYGTDHLRLAADLDELTTRIDQHLGAAIESTVRARRGRPRKSTLR